MRDLVERGELTEEEAQAMMNGTTLRPPRMKEWDYPKPRRFAPTPTASDHIERVSTSTEKMNSLTGKSVSLDRFVKFWPTQEIQKSGKPEMWPTPTAMDNKEDALKHATKLLQGKTHRSSGQPIQKTLSDKVMMDLIIKHPELMELYQDHQMEERPNLPPQQEFVDYLRLQTTIKDLSEKTNIKKTTIEHWFRKDDKGFSYPSIENWEQIKPHLKEIKYDKEMTTLESKEWTKKKSRNVANTKDSSGEQTEWERGESVGGGGVDSVWSEDKRNDLERAADVANTNDTRNRTSEHEAERERSESIAKGQGESQSELGGQGSNVANTKSINRNEHELVRENGNLETQEVSGDRNGLSDSEGESTQDHSQTFSSFRGIFDGLSGWLDEPRHLERTTHKNEYRAERLKQLGNALLPQITYRIGLAIKECEDDK